MTKREQEQRCRTCDGRGWSLAYGTYLQFCNCERGRALKKAVEVRDRRRGEGRAA